MWHAWYSEEMAKRTGTWIYRHEDGREVEITCITINQDHGTKWDDMAYLGIVTESIRRGRERNPEISKGEFIIPTIKDGPKLTDKHIKEFEKYFKD
jgi:hypothetical protein